MTDRKYIITDEDMNKAMLKEAVNIESRIEELESSEDVKLAKRYNEVRAERVAYLQKLKELERLGQRLRDIGWEVPDDAED